MKIPLFILLLCQNLMLHSQENNLFNLPLDSATGLITFQSIEVVPNTSKDQLYSRAKQWIANYYNSAKDVINVDDKETGLLKLKGLSKEKQTQEGLTFNSFTHYDLFIYLKDNRYKCVINNLLFQTDAGGRLDELTALEKPLLFTRQSPDMKYYDFRKAWSEKIESLGSEILLSLKKSMQTDSNFNF